MLMIHEVVCEVMRVLCDGASSVIQHVGQVHRLGEHR